MPRANRCSPFRTLEAVPDRGLFWGNRGNLHNPEGEIRRQYNGSLWLICVLEFKGRRRRQMRPGRLTELYFLDEATGLAAGHRPCGECRIDAYRAFRDRWAALHPEEKVSAGAINASLHADRLTADRRQRTYEARAADLPDGAMVDLDGSAWLVLGDGLRAWSYGGYGERRRPPRGPVTVLTPRTTVDILAAGYAPELHPSAVS